MMRLTLLAATLLCLTSAAQAKVHRVESIIDGDTLTIGSNGMAASLRIRALNYDTPETNSSCAAERALGLRAKARLEALAAQGLRVVSELELDMYGRILGELWTPNGERVADVLIREGLARAYDGKTARRPWCDAAGQIVR